MFFALPSLGKPDCKLLFRNSFDSFFAYAAYHAFLGIHCVLGHLLSFPPLGSSSSSSSAQFRTLSQSPLDPLDFWAGPETFFNFNQKTFCCCCWCWSWVLVLVVGGRKKAFNWTREYTLQTIKRRQTGNVYEEWKWKQSEYKLTTNLIKCRRVEAGYFLFLSLRSWGEACLLRK